MVVTGKTDAEGGHDDGGAQVMGQLFRELGAALTGAAGGRSYPPTEDGQGSPHGSTSDSVSMLATRADVQNAIEDVVASAMGSQVQPGILKIAADDVQAHCT